MAFSKLGHEPGTAPRYDDHGPAREREFQMVQGGGWRGGQIEDTLTERQRHALGVQPRGAVIDALQTAIERDGLPKTSEEQLFDAYRNTGRRTKK